LLFSKERQKEQSLIRSFAKSKKRAIAHLLFSKERQKELSFFLKKQMSERSLNLSFEKSKNEL